MASYIHYPKKLEELLKDNAKSGFFLDEQLSKPSLCWELWCQEKPSTGGTWNELLLRAIINDETPTIQYDVRHRFPDMGTGNTISGYLKSLYESQKRMQASVGALAGGIESIIDTVRSRNKTPEELAAEGAERQAKKEEDRSIGQSIKDTFKGTGFEGVVNTVVDNIKDYSRGSLMTGNESIKYYGDTNINIKTPSLKFRYYHNMYNGISVKDLVSILNSRLIGDFSGSGDLTTTSGSSIGIMTAPNEYDASGMDVIGLDKDNPKKGTFMIRYAGRDIPNLVCTNYSVEFSTTKVKDSSSKMKSMFIASDEYKYASPDKLQDAKDKKNSYNSISNTDSYLYADITLDFEHIAVYTKNNINSIINV